MKNQPRRYAGTSELRPARSEAKATDMGPEQHEYCTGCNERLLSMTERVSIGSQEQKEDMRARRCWCVDAEVHGG